MQHFSTNIFGYDLPGLQSLSIGSASSQLSSNVERTERHHLQQVDAIQAAAGHISSGPSNCSNHNARQYHAVGQMHMAMFGHRPLLRSSSNAMNQQNVLSHSIESILTPRLPKCTPEHQHPGSCKEFGNETNECSNKYDQMSHSPIESSDRTPKSLQSQYNLRQSNSVRMNQSPSNLATVRESLPLTERQSMPEYICTQTIALAFGKGPSEQCNEYLKTFFDNSAFGIHDSTEHSRIMYMCLVKGCPEMFASRQGRNRHSANYKLHARQSILRRKRLIARPFPKRTQS